MDFKKNAAQKAITFIQEKSIVALGAGSTIAYIVDLLAAAIKDGLEIKVLTSSFTTRQLLVTKGFDVEPISDFARVDIYMDGCDQLDRHLNALKSGGGIHTHEKLLASMAKLFLLVGDESKYSQHFDDRFPLVIEFLPEAFRFVPERIQQRFPGVKIVTRMSDKMAGPAITHNGNYLLDVWFPVWPELRNINPIMKEITGVIETSLFYNLAHKAVLAGKDGTNILEKPGA